MDPIREQKGLLSSVILGLVLLVAAGQTLANEQEARKSRHTKTPKQQVNNDARKGTAGTARQGRAHTQVRRDATSQSVGANHGQEVSSQRLAAIEAWKSSGQKGPPPWAGVGGGPGGNPNHPGQGREIGHDHVSGLPRQAERGGHQESDGETPAAAHGRGKGRDHSQNSGDEHRPGAGRDNERGLGDDQGQGAGRGHGAGGEQHNQKAKKGPRAGREN
jgi:hypothetical protein